MNYKQILQWIEKNMTELREYGDGEFVVNYLDNLGRSKSQTGDSLIDCVLRINAATLSE